MRHRMGAYIFSVILTRLRRSTLPIEWYKALVIHVKSFLVDKPDSLPFVSAEWRRLIVGFPLYSEMGIRDWAPILHTFAAFGIHVPNDLAQSTRSDNPQLPFENPHRPVDLCNSAGLGDGGRSQIIDAHRG